MVRTEKQKKSSQKVIHTGSFLIKFVSQNVRNLMILSVQIVKDRFMQESIWFEFQDFGLSTTEYTKYAQKNDC